MANKNTQDKISVFQRLISYIVKIFSTDGEASSTRIVFVIGTFSTLFCGFVMLFYTLIHALPDKERIGSVAAIIAAIFGGMVAIISALAACKGYISKQENKTDPPQN